jgi:DNA-binding IclR family transcriptional regulator
VDDPEVPPGAPTGRSTVARIAAVLEALATTDGGVGVRALARSSGIDRSAVGRLLKQLSDLGLAVPADVPGRYAIGARLFAIAGAVTSRDELRAAARPALESLAARFNETSYLAVIEGGRVVYRDVIESSQPVRYVAELGVPTALHAGAAGRAILAGMSDEEYEAWQATAELGSLTPATVVAPDVLAALRATDRERGFSTSRGERVSGGAAVAAPFVDAGGRVRGSLVVTCPETRLPAARAAEIGAVVLVTAQHLSWRLGAVVGPARRVPARTTGTTRRVSAAARRSRPPRQ